MYFRDARGVVLSLVPTHLDDGAGPPLSAGISSLPPGTPDIPAGMTSPPLPSRSCDGPEDRPAGGSDNFHTSGYTGVYGDSAKPVEGQYTEPLLSQA